MSRRNPGVVAGPERVQWREVYGDLPALLDAATAEQHAGRLKNAWVGYTLALQHWLALHLHGTPWAAKAKHGKIVSLAVRLHRNGVIDRWTLRMVQHFHNRPKAIEWWHVDALAGFVFALTQERGRMANR